MIVRRAKLLDEINVLEMYDLFIDYTNIPQEDSNYQPSISARTNSREIFKSVINSDNSRLLVAEEDGSIIGILEIHKVPRIKKGNVYGELELMFVRESYHGKGVAKELMNSAVEWAKAEKLDCIRLYSGYDLHRAHAFYEKMGFKDSGKTYVLHF